MLEPRDVIFLILVLSFFLFPVGYLLERKQQAQRLHEQQERVEREEERREEQRREEVRAAFRQAEEEREAEEPERARIEEELRAEYEARFRAEYERMARDQRAARTPNRSPLQQARLAKLRALMAKTVENGCTEAEANAAATKVGELLMRHWIELEELS